MDCALCAVPCAQPLVALALPALLPRVAHGEETAAEPTYAACREKAGGMTVAMIECMTAEAERHDKRLNQASAVLRERPADGRRQLLQDEQRVRESVSRRYCAFWDDPDGDTLAQVSANACAVILTTCLADELESLLQQAGAVAARLPPELPSVDALISSICGSSWTCAMLAGARDMDPGSSICRPGLQGK